MLCCVEGSRVLRSNHQEISIFPLLLVVSVFASFFSGKSEQVLVTDQQSKAFYQCYWVTKHSQFPHGLFPLLYV